MADLPSPLSTKQLETWDVKKFTAPKKSAIDSQSYSGKMVFITDIQEKNNQYSIINDFTLLEKSVSFLFLFFFCHLKKKCFQMVVSGASGRLHRDRDVEAQRQRGEPLQSAGRRVGHQVLQ